MELATPYTSLFLSRLENFKRETVDAHDPAPADIVNIPLPHSTCFRPVCNTPSPPWNVRWTRMILHAPKRALKRCHLTCIQNFPGATSPLKSHQQLPTKIGHLAFISLFPYNDYCVYLSHGKYMIHGYSGTCYLFPWLTWCYHQAHCFTTDCCREGFPSCTLSWSLQDFIAAFEVVVLVSSSHYNH